MMTREEIERAAKDYVDKSINEEHIYDDIGLIKSAARVDFMAGVEFANKHWQEKAKYKSLSEKLPQQGEPVIFKFTKNVQKVHCRLGFIGLGFIFLDRGDSLSEREAKELGAFWKELE